MWFNRSQLKEMKKDILEQLEEGITGNDIYVKGFITYGEDIYEGMEEEAYFDGRITKKELNITGNDYEWKIYEKQGLVFEILEDENNKGKYDVYFTVKVLKINEYDMIDSDFITLSI